MRGRGQGVSMDAGDGRSISEVSWGAVRGGSNWGVSGFKFKGRGEFLV